MADFVSLADQRRMHITLPPLSEQRAIAGILGALDDKIELNRRMNRTLESMARGVFGEMMKDELGRMKVEKLGNICEFAYGKALKADGRNTGAIPVYGSNGQIGWHDEHLVKGPGIVVGRKGNPGIVTWTQNDFFPIDTTFYVVPKKSETSLYWLYYTLISLNLPDLGADSAVPGLNRNIAYMSDVNYPPYDLMNRFDEFAKSLFDKIYANEKESRTLASLRDGLLPRLMRGEVRVKS
jgi:type I restriction enzyme S subunit